MKLNDLYKIFLVTEDGIDNLEFVGNWDSPKNHGWSKADQKILKSPNGVERMKRLWKKVHQPFDVYLAKSFQMSKFAEIGRVSPEFVKDKLGLDIPFNDDNITVIFTNNTGAEKMPATPWTLAHRFGHALNKVNGSGAENPQYEYVRKEVDKLFHEISNFVYRTDLKKLQNPTGYGYYGDNMDGNKKARQMKKQLATALGTFKSARDKNIRNDSEFINEIIAQYMITGKIVLNTELPKVLPMRYVWGRADGPYHKELSEDEKEELTDIIRISQNTIEFYINDLLDGAIGNIYVM
jgi:hypothetical protein